MLPPRCVDHRGTGGAPNAHQHRALHNPLQPLISTTVETAIDTPTKAYRDQWRQENCP